MSVGTADGQDLPSRLSPVIGQLGSEFLMSKRVSTKNLSCMQNTQQHISRVSSGLLIYTDFLILS